MDVVGLQMAKADAKKNYLSLATLPRVTAVARRGPVRRAAPPLTSTAAADAPTVTYPAATTSSITSAKAWTADPAVTGTGAYVGCVVGGLVSGRWATLAPSKSNGVVNDLGQANNQRNPGLIKRDMMFDGVKLEVDISNKGAGNYRVQVDDTYVGGPVPTAVASDGANHLLTLDFTSAGGAKPRRIRIELYNHEIRQFYTGPADTLWTPVQRGPVVGVIGDSYAAGSAQGGSGAISTWPSLLTDYLGADAVYNMGIGGTGVNTANNSTFGGGPKYRDHLAADLGGLPLDVLIIGGTHNDTNNGALQTEMQTLFTTCRATWPNAVIIIIGPFSPGSAVASYTSHMTTINAAVAATPGCVDFVIDPITQPWFTGTGNAGTRSVADGVLNSTTTITSATAAFSAANVGNNVSGTGIPAGAYISAVTNSTTATISAAATATASGVTLTFDKAKRDGNSDKYIGTDNIHPVEPNAGYAANGIQYLGRRVAAALATVLQA